jgi:hypothetical protein
MTVPRPVILLEFNELTPSLIDRFIREGELPNFARFRDEAAVYTTDAEEEQDKLNPWIQWVTVHSGLSFAEHGVFNLDDGHKLKEKSIWDLASDAGLTVWICGSMNVKHEPGLRGFVLPDPWSITIRPHPDALGPYYRFVQRQVQEHTNERSGLGPADYVRFLTFMVGHGLSSGTVWAILRQLAGERRRPGSGWKRAALLDRLQWDVFRWYYRKAKPALSTFFLNSTAHLQHKYWRNLEPERFTIQPTVQEQERFDGAILYGYQQMDALLRRFFDLAGDDATLVLSTGLSQQPCLIYEGQGGKIFYRPKSFDQLLAFAEVRAPYTCSPVMSEQFRIYFPDEESAKEAERRLRALHAGGEPALVVEREGAAVFSGCRIFHSLAADTALRSAGSEKSVAFFEVFYQSEGAKSGMHHPDGVLWIRTPERQGSVHPSKVPLRSVAPTILELLGLPRPGYMRAEPLTRQDEPGAARVTGAARSPRPGDGQGRSHRGAVRQS